MGRVPETIFDRPFNRKRAFGVDRPRPVVPDHLRLQKDPDTLKKEAEAKKLAARQAAETLARAARKTT